MCIFQRFETLFDEDTPPPLADEWLTPEEKAINQHRSHLQKLRHGRKLWQDDKSKDKRDDLHFQAPSPAQPQVSHREIPDRLPLLQTQQLPSTWTREPPIVSTPTTDVTVEAIPVTAPRRNPSRTAHNKKPETLNMDPKLKTYSRPSSMLCCALAMTFGITPISGHMLQSQVTGYSPLTNTQESFHPGILQSPLALKAKISKDPDLPSLKESLMGPHADHFWAAMDKEIASLEGKGTWHIVQRSSMPSHLKAVPGTWVQRIKRLPDGQLNKFKSRWCCRGDLQSYEGTAYSPLVGWPTVRAGLL